MDKRAILKEILKKHQVTFEISLSQYFATQKGEKTPLREACEYALSNGGKRFRPALVYMVADALKQKKDVSDAALSIEFFHTASLIADDLPCMDNDDERRNKPSTHKVFGEATALLASYALIAAGYGLIATAAKQSAIKDGRVVVEALLNASENAGLEGLAGGQFLDINPPNLSLETLTEILKKKTVSLFDASFVFGWLFGGGDLNLLPLVKKAAFHFGMAFQIADDLGDVRQDKEKGRSVNMALTFGVTKAKERLVEEVESYKHSLNTLQIATEELSSLGDLLNFS